jgi:hypothetical protein
VFPETDLTVAFRRLGHTLEEIEESTHAFVREHAPLFSPLEVLVRSETGLSRIFKYLLDEKAGHGQGRTFLDQFLKIIDCPKREFQSVSVTTEWPIERSLPSRRIDVVLKLDDYMVGIENKPWAGESDWQCRDYAEALHLRSRGQSMLVLLTPDGRKPISAGEFLPHVKSLRYDELVEQFNTSCVKVQAFLCDLRRYVREQISNITNPCPTEEKMIRECLQPENIKVTVEILVLAREIRQQLIKSFCDALLARVRLQFGGDWEAELLPEARPVRDFDAAWCGLYLFKAGWRNRYAIGFSNERPNADKFIFGIFYWNRSRDARIASGNLHKELSEAFDGRGENSRAWDWFLSLSQLEQPDYKYWYAPEVIRRMASGSNKMVDDLYPLVQKTIEIASCHIDREAAQEFAREAR